MRALFLVGVVLAAGCATNGVETQRSRDRLNCVYAARYDDGLTPAQRKKAEAGCPK